MEVGKSVGVEYNSAWLVVLVPENRTKCLEGNNLENGITRVALQAFAHKL
jgi:hypothetical protein